MGESISPGGSTYRRWTFMHAQHALSTVEVEIQEFAATLHRCFHGVSWDVVNYYAAQTWTGRADAQWSEVRSRVRTAWEAGQPV